MSTIWIKQWNSPISSRKGTILDAALAAGVPFPHSCRAGDCGDCKARVIDGEVASLGLPDPTLLSREERDGGVILACRSRAKTDVTMEWMADVDPADAAPIRKTRGKVVALDDMTHDTRRLLLEVDDSPLMFVAGQFANLQFGKLPTRSYSMANRPDEPLLEFHIRRVPGGGASGYVADRLKLGEIVGVEGPFGTATLDPDHEGPIVAAAGGAGLAPVMSVVRTALAKQFAHPLYLYFGVREERDIYNEGALQALAASHPNFRFEIVLSRGAGPRPRREGYVQQAIAVDIPTLTNAKFYVAGPPRMVSAVTEFAKSWGVNDEHIHADAFTPSIVTESGGGLIGRLRGLFGA